MIAIVGLVALLSAPLLGFLWLVRRDARTALPTRTPPPGLPDSL